MRETGKASILNTILISARRGILISAVSLLTLPLAAQPFDELQISAAGGKSVTTWHGQADVQALHIEMGRRLSDRTTVALVASPMNFWQPRSWFGSQFDDGNETVRAFSLSLLGRRTFRRGSPLEWFIEGSTGPMVAGKRVPASTSRFNFVSQAGAGVVLRAQSRYPIVAGYRFSHISNGGYSPRNPGLNVSSFVVGVRFRTASLRRH